MIFLVNALTIFFLTYFTLQLLKSILFWTYIIQLKEYRYDRIKAHFKTYSGKRQLVNNFNLLKWKNFFYPVPTPKIILIWVFIINLSYNIFFLFLKNFYLRLKILSINALSILLIIIIFLNLLVPILTFFSLLITSIFFVPLKHFIYFLAWLKIKKLKNLTIVGITGSFGKTATKEILSILLEGSYQTIKTPLNCNSRLGISLFILKNLKRKHEIFIVEMGAYRKKEIKGICKIVYPKIGLITGINEQHLELFKNINNTILAKYELIESLPKSGLALFNGKCQVCVDMARKTKLRKIIYKEKPSIKTGLLGDWQNINVSGAIEIAKYFKVNKKVIVKKLKRLRFLPLALSKKKGIKGSYIIDDSYSTNPTGFISALNFLNNCKKSKKILITPGIIELGSASERIHQKIGAKAAEICDQIILTKKDFFKSVKKGACQEERKINIQVITDPEKLIEKLKKSIGKNTAILIEGRVAKTLINKLVIK